MVSLADVRGFIAEVPLPHPFWVVDWAEANHVEVATCSAVLFFSGVLCSAAGIGGGGIYVAVLMIVGGLTPHDAVPLSKAVVFLGSLASLVLNMRRSRGSGSGSAPPVIDYVVVRLVVPAALIGTLLGVLFNQHTADGVVVLVLTGVLVFMTFMVTRTAIRQHQEESKAADGPSGRGAASARPEAEEDEEDADAVERQPLVPQDTPRPPSTVVPSKSTRGQLLTLDVVLGCFMLLLVAGGGVMRFHMHSCREEVAGRTNGQISGVGSKACSHPIITSLFGPFGLQAHPDFHEMMDKAMLAVPLVACVFFVLFYFHDAWRYQQWRAREVFSYQAMGVATGFLAGLVGVGGGLVFSPFFLLVGMDPSVAVGTSATCVIFTSSSTTLQYLFTDRIMMSLAIVYGLVNAVASFIGTSAVHYLQDKFSTRRSFITWIVVAGVAISSALSVMKFVRMTAAGGAVVSH